MKSDDTILMALGLGMLAAGLAATAKPGKDNLPTPGPKPSQAKWSDLKPGSSGETVKAWQKLLCRSEEHTSELQSR